SSLRAKIGSGIKRVVFLLFSGKGEYDGDAGEEWIDSAPGGEGCSEGNRVLQGRVGCRGTDAHADRRWQAHARDTQDRRCALDAVRRLPRILRRRLSCAEWSVASHATSE